MFLSRSPCIPPLYTKPTLSVCTTLDTVPRFRFHLSSLLVELINYRETTLHFFCPVFSARVTQIPWITLQVPASVRVCPSRRNLSLTSSKNIICISRIPLLYILLVLT